MTDPPQGSDYWWSQGPGTVWQGNAKTIFNSLKQANIRPVITIRNVDNGWNPSLVLVTHAARNRRLERVVGTRFCYGLLADALGYYRVDDWEIHNEPDNRLMGWGGTRADYFELVKVAKDAIGSLFTKLICLRLLRIHTAKLKAAAIPVVLRKKS